MNGDILIVEDDEDVRVGLARLISGRGHRVAAVASAEEGLAELAERETDVVLTDIHMTGMDGMAMTAQIRRAHPGIDVIIMTGQATVETAGEALRLGAFDYLLKPFPSNELVMSSIERALQKRQLQADRLRAVDALHALNVELDTRVRERTAELEAVNEELEAFSYSVSHDLRAPLRAIDGFSKAVLDDCGDTLGRQAAGYLGRIRSETARMEALIHSLLQLARVAERDLHKQDVDLAEIARAAERDLRLADPDRSVEVVIADQLPVAGDEHLLADVVANLVGNAWKYTAKEPAARIEVGASRLNGQATIYVRDNGAGFDMTYAHKLFTAFQRLHSQSEFEGTGVGLATVQRIIRRHGGRIWAEAQVGCGATFYFTLEASLS